MSSVINRHVPDEAHRAIEAQMCETAVKPQYRVKLGSLLAEVGRKVRLTEEEFTLFESAQNSAPTTDWKPPNRVA